MTLSIKRSLLVEDNAIIAMDCEEMLRELGAETVEVCSTVQSALAYLSKDSVDFAMLDVNLGSETSAPIAERLTEQNIPFLFATGHEDVPDFASPHAQANVVQKPYSVQTIEQAISQLKPD